MQSLFVVVKRINKEEKSKWLKRKFKRLIIIIQLMITTVFFLGCNNESVEEVSKINLNKGAFVDESTHYETFNLNSENTYEEIDTEDRVITNFNDGI